MPDNKVNFHLVLDATYNGAKYLNISSYRVTNHGIEYMALQKLGFVPMERVAYIIPVENA